MHAALAKGKMMTNSSTMIFMSNLDRSLCIHIFSYLLADALGKKLKSEDFNSRDNLLKALDIPGNHLEWNCEIGVKLSASFSYVFVTAISAIFDNVNYKDSIAGLHCFSTHMNSLTDYIKKGFEELPEGPTIKGHHKK